MNIYVAGNDKGAAGYIHNLLVSSGFGVTSSWYGDTIQRISSNWGTKLLEEVEITDETIDKITNESLITVKDIERADVFLQHISDINKDVDLIGLGIAYGLGKEIIVFGERVHPLLYLPGIKQIFYVEDIIEAVRGAR